MGWDMQSLPCYVLCLRCYFCWMLWFWDLGVSIHLQVTFCYCGVSIDSLRDSESFDIWTIQSLFSFSVLFLQINWPFFVLFVTLAVMRFACLNNIFRFVLRKRFFRRVRVTNNRAFWTDWDKSFLFPVKWQVLLICWWRSMGRDYRSSF